jgi:hypothetical protein
MSDDDDEATLWGFFGSQKRENDRRARLGLPLDGNYDRSRSEQPSYDSGGGDASSLVGSILKVLFVFALYAGAAILWLSWQILIAIFSRRR